MTSSIMGVSSAVDDGITPSIGVVVGVGAVLTIFLIGMAYLPSPAQLASGRNDAIVEQVLGVVAVISNSHLQNNGAVVDTVEERLFTNNGAFDGQYDRWAEKRRRRGMLAAMRASIQYFAERHGLTAFPSEMMNVARRLQNEIDDEAMAYQIDREEREREAQIRAENNALYEGGLGLLPDGHSNGPSPADPGLAAAYRVIPK